MGEFLRIEDLDVYRRLCQLHIEICDLSRTWPPEERFELGAQIRKSSNSAPANVAEKHSDRHVRNKIEGVNRGRGEACETLHHLFIAKLKGTVKEETYSTYRERYQECIRMLNGIEKKLEMQLPEQDRRWPANPRTLNPDP